MQALTQLSPKEIGDAIAEAVIAGEVQEIVQGNEVWLTYTGPIEPPKLDQSVKAASTSE
jgi:hypothetical protein